MKNKRLIILASIAAALLSVPLIAMQFTNEMNWDARDFTIMGCMLFGTVTIIEVVLRSIQSTNKRIIFCGCILLLFFLVWAELAVGVFGTPFAGS